MEVHRSRHELEHVLNKYGADEVLFVEADANASIQFAMHGHCVQLALPLPDPHDARFTHTPSGKPRTTSARERAYDQALREHWRSLIVAVRGKLQSVESGISTFEQEFDRFLVPHFAAEEKRRNRKAPKAVSWLLGGSHTLAIALVAAFLVPASAVGAFALPTNVVGQLAAPFHSLVTETGSGQDGNGVALARGGWAPSNRDASSRSADVGRLLALRSARALLGDASSEVRQEASLTTPPVDEGNAPAPQPELASNNTTPIPSEAPPSPPAPPAAGGGGQPPAHNDPPPADDPPAPAVPPEDTIDSSSTDTGSGDAADQPVSEPAADDSPSADQPDTTAPPSTGSDTAPGNGNGNANGQTGTPPGQGGTPPGQGGTPPGQDNPPPGQGNTPPGNANGQNGTQGQGNGQGNGKAQGNGKGKGGK